MLYDIFSNFIYSLENQSGNFNVKLELTNIMDVQIPFQTFFALKDGNGKVVSILKKENILQVSNDIQTFSLLIDFNMECSKNWTVECFVWKNDLSITPLSGRKIVIP